MQQPKEPLSPTDEAIRGKDCDTAINILRHYHLHDRLEMILAVITE
jgi:hypothetical protein